MTMYPAETASHGASRFNSAAAPSRGWPLKLQYTANSTGSVIAGSLLRSAAA